jgi:hypothetical protein
MAKEKKIILAIVSALVAVGCMVVCKMIKDKQ